MKRIFICLSLVLIAAAAAAEPTLHQSLFSADGRKPFRLNDRPLLKHSAMNLDESPALAPVNKGKAFFMSLLLPGWGQRYVGANRKSAAFFGVEVGLWLTYSGFRTYSAWREDDYRNYAASHAGVQLDGKSSSYFIDVGNFSSIYDYNEYKLRQRNTLDYYQDVEKYYWNWRSEADRAYFDKLRISSDTALNRSTFVLGVIVANHIISAVEAVWSAHQQEKKQALFDWDLQFGWSSSMPQVQLALSKSF
ncbi:MAG: hypothetical protein EHM72_11070 [Calditrichaeota bacterium]|nr:MAG: hypothetical protein EHM72_11070 [Calditrichota bacterium]